MLLQQQELTDLRSQENGQERPAARQDGWHNGPLRVQNTRAGWSRLRNELVRLDFLSRFFTWVFMLLSRLAEPLMTLSAIYIAVEAGLPRLSLSGLHEAAVAVMIAAPEIILPGSFGMAAQARRHGQPSRMLYAVSWSFVGLTGLTLLSLFVLHLDASAFQVITFLRCGAGVSYSILIRILTQGQAATPLQRAPQAANSVQVDMLAAFGGLAERMERALERVERTARPERENDIATSSDSERRLTATIERQFGACEERLTERVQHILDRFAAFADEQLQEIQARRSASPASATNMPAAHNASNWQSAAKGRSSDAPPNVRSLTRRADWRTTTATAEAIATDKGAFVRTCLSEQPDLRNSDIRRKAAERSLRISPSYISETRKAFLYEHHHLQRDAFSKITPSTDGARTAGNSVEADEGMEVSQVNPTAKAGGLHLPAERVTREAP